MEIPCTPIPPLCCGRKHDLGSYRHDLTRSTYILLCNGEPTTSFACSECAPEIVSQINRCVPEVWGYAPINKGHLHPDGHRVAQPIPGITTPAD